MPMPSEQSRSGDAPPIITHVEQYLGPVIDGWKTTGDGESLAFPLARFNPMPQEGWSVLATLGLSAFSFAQPSGKELRQELLLCWPDAAMEDSVPSHLYGVGKAMMAGGEAVGLGALLPLPKEPILPSGHAEPWVAWFVTAPFFLPEAATICRGTEPPTVLTWLVPVYAKEAEMIDAQGPEAFEAKLLQQRAGLFHWPRQSLADE